MLNVVRAACAHRAPWLLVPVAGAIAASAAVAAGMAFNIAPLRLEINGAQEFAPFQVRNTSDSALAVQARVFVWGQGPDGDRYSLSDDLVVSPSVTRLGPGEVQHFKLIRRTSGAATELSYRVVIDQLPNREAVSTTALMPRLRMAVPVFIDRAGASAAKVDWTAEKGVVRVANRGGRSARVSDAAAIRPDGTRVTLNSPTMGYVLAGADVRWPLDTPATCLPAGTRVVGMMDGARFDAPVRSTC